MVTRKQVSMNEHGYIFQTLSRMEVEPEWVPFQHTINPDLHFCLDVVKCIQRALLRSSSSSGASSFSGESLRPQCILIVILMVSFHNSWQSSCFNPTSAVILGRSLIPVPQSVPFPPQLTQCVGCFPLLGPQSLPAFYTENNKFDLQI